MLLELAELLRCPVTGSTLQLNIRRSENREFLTGEEKVVWEGFLEGDEWIYPIIEGVPRLLPESFLEHEPFLRSITPEFNNKKEFLLKSYWPLIEASIAKNKRTKQSFSEEWKLFNYQGDKVWDMDSEGLLERFLNETGESESSLNDKLILDVGCGNGLLNQFIASKGATIIGIDISLSIERAFRENKQRSAFFIQADMQRPPFSKGIFDVVHASGSLHHTNNTRFSFSTIAPLVRAGGKLSVWLYHPSKDRIHNIINRVRARTSRLPLKGQMFLYKYLLFPISFVVKRAKNNRQNKREMMIDILDWFSPEFRWEHTEEEVRQWFEDHHFSSVRTTAKDRWGFNTIGIRQ